MRPAARNSSGPISPRSKGFTKIPSGPARQKPLKTCFAEVQRELAKIVATFNQDVEGAELHLLVVLAGVQRIEIRDAVDSKDHAGGPLVVSKKTYAAGLEIHCPGGAVSNWAAQSPATIA
jgi:hypothetical protein